MALEFCKAILAANDNLKQKLPNEARNINPFRSVFEADPIKKKLFKMPYNPVVESQRRRAQSSNMNQTCYATSDGDSIFPQKARIKIQPTKALPTVNPRSGDPELQISYLNNTATKNIVVVASKTSKQRSNSPLNLVRPNDPIGFGVMAATQNITALSNKILANMLRNEPNKRAESPFRDTMRQTNSLFPPLQSTAGSDKRAGESIDKLESVGSGVEHYTMERMRKIIANRANSSQDEGTNPKLNPSKTPQPNIQSKNPTSNEAATPTTPSNPVIRPRSSSVQPVKTVNRNVAIKVIDGGKLFGSQMSQKEKTNKPPKVTAKSWALLSSGAGFLRGKKESKPREIASLTKIMTCYICLKFSESIGLSLSDEKIKVSKYAASMSGTSANLKAGDILSLIDLLHGLMLPSGNDAAVALAEHFGRLPFRKSDDCREKSEEEGIPLNQVKCNKPIGYFVREMNRMAREMRLGDTNYANPHGLSNKMNLSTAKDQGELSLIALKDKTFREIVNTQRHVATVLDKTNETKEYVWENTNVLLQKGYDGVKTGTTSTAGPCLVSSLTKQGKTIVCVVLCSSTTDARWSDVTQLTEFAFAS